MVIKNKEDLLNHHLKHVSCKIDGRVVKKGLIYITDDKKIYIFQNSADGSKPGGRIPEEYPYKYSWCYDGHVRSIVLLDELTDKWWWND